MSELYDDLHSGEVVDADYVRATCGVIVHVDDVDEHNAGGETCEPCEARG